MQNYKNFFFHCTLLSDSVYLLNVHKQHAYSFYWGCIFSLRVNRLINPCQQTLIKSRRLYNLYILALLKATSKVIFLYCRVY